MGKDRTLQAIFIWILEFAEVTLEDTGLIFEMIQRDRLAQKNKLLLSFESRYDMIKWADQY